MTLKELRIPALLLTGFVLAAAATRASVTETFKQTYPLAADGAIHLENVNGDIDIVAWDKAEVSLEAEKKGKTDDDLAKTTLEIDSTPTKLSIKTRHAKKSSWRFGSVNAAVRYKLMVPAGVRLQKIEAVNSDITVSGVRGAMVLETVNGGVKATGLAADAHLESVNGSLHAEFASLDGVREVKLESVNGRAALTLPKNSGARLDADSVNGSVNIEQQVKLGRIRHHSLSGEIGGGGGPEISLETVNGSISIREK